ncbi:MAG TPA: hypothetical protein VLZ51_01225 [Brevundimonas sp.]|nr:hypothetical protein [Brevundimonas sp.]HUH22663.1 hypothetical protein [Brevundimonas sp.]
MKRTAFAVVLALTATSSAQAQSIFEQMARRAVEGAAARAGAALERSVTGTMERGRQGDGAAAGGTGEGAARESVGPEVMRPRARSSTAPAARTPTAQPAAVAAAGAAPWPVNAGAGVSRPGKLEFSAADEARKAAFDDFGRVKCTACEGGRSYDSWAQQRFNLRGHGAWDRKLGELGRDEVITWQGVEAHGRITVVGETPVGGFRCKQLKWELFKGTETAQRDGLVCFGLSSDYSASESWVEVF